MKSYNIMIKPASSMCNMRCKYCFYEDVAAARSVANRGMMSNSSMKAMLLNIKKDLKPTDRVSFVFQGGEPTLAGLEFFESFTAEVSKWEGIKVSYALQTNGILLDDKWCQFLRKHNFLVGISCDILADMHDGARVDSKGGGTFKQVVSVMELLKKQKVEFNVLCTLTNYVARHPEKVWNQLVKLGVDYVQFTPCLGFFEDIDSPYALTPKRFATFYTALFGYWYKDYRSGKYRSIKLFDDVVNFIILKRPTLCGMDGVCRPQMVVEADGSVYPCDFYCVDEYKLGNLTKQSIAEILASPVIYEFLNRESKSLPEMCNRCEFKSFCGGNCRRMRKEICFDKNENYCGYKEFLQKCGTELFKLANECRFR